MSLIDSKIGDWTNPVVKEADRPQRSADEMKAVFDSNSNQLKTALNAAIDRLTSTGGAEDIGVSPVTGLEAATVQEAIFALKDYADSVGVAGGTLVSVNGQVGKDITLDYEDVGAASAPAHYTVTLGTENWTGSAAPYTQTVNVSGILASDRPIVDAALTGTDSTDKAILKAWGLVGRIVTADGSITATCYDEKPEVDFSFQMEVIR